MRAPILVPEDRAPILGRIRNALDTPGTQLLVSGEPGIGKSFLLETALRDSVTARPVRFSQADGTRQRPYQTLTDLLVDTPVDVIRSMPESEQRAYEWATAGSDGDNRVPPVRALAAAISHVLTRDASRRSALIVENWQWVDQESMQLLREAFARPAVRTAVSLVATIREPSLPDAAAPTELFDLQDIATVPGIGAGDLQKVLQLERELTAADVSRIARLSRGNPRWAFELAAQGGERDPSQVVPPLILQCIRECLDALSPGVVRLLRVVSALGRVRISNGARFLPDGGEHLAAAVAAGVVRVDKTWIRPAHALMASGSLQLLDAPDRLRLFTDLSELPLPQSERVGMRDAATTSGVDESLAHDLYTAAANERQAGALAPAVHFARRAVIRTTAGSHYFVERQLRAASYSLAAGDLDSAIDDLADLQTAEMSDGTFDRLADVLAEALHRKGGGALVGSTFTSLLTGGTVSRAHRNIISVHLIAFGRRRTANDLDRLRAIDAELSELAAPRAKAAAKSALLEIEVDMGAGFDEHALAALRLLETQSAPATVERNADAIEGFLSYQTDDMERSRAALHTARFAARTSGETYALAQVLAHSAVVETLSGRLARAEGLLNEVLDADTALRHDVPASVYRARALLALANSNDNQIDEIAASSLSPGGEDRGELLRKSVLGLRAAQSGESATAVELLSSAVHTAERHGIVEPGRRMWVDVELVRALIRVGAHDRVPSALARVQQAARNPRRLHATGQLDRLEALVHASRGDIPSALALMDRGVSRILGSGFRLEAAHALLDQTTVLLAAGAPTSAVETLRRAEKMNDDIESLSLAQSISLLRSTHPLGNDADVLTPSERRVADLIAAGYSNRSVAAELHLSVRTVEAHLSSMYRKTGAGSRTQLIVWMKS